MKMICIVGLLLICCVFAKAQDELIEEVYLPGPIGEQCHFLLDYDTSSFSPFSPHNSKVEDRYFSPGPGTFDFLLAYVRKKPLERLEILKRECNEMDDTTSYVIGDVYQISGCNLHVSSRFFDFDIMKTGKWKICANYRYKKVIQVMDSLLQARYVSPARETLENDTLEIFRLDLSLQHAYFGKIPCQRIDILPCILQLRYLKIDERMFKIIKQDLDTLGLVVTPEFYENGKVNEANLKIAMALWREKIGCE